jgi:hypothetical protein
MLMELLSRIEAAEKERTEIEFELLELNSA